MAKSNTAKTAAPPKPIRLRIKLGVSKAPGLNGTVWIENVEFDGPRTSLLFGKYYKVCVYVNDKTKTVVPVLYLDNGSGYGGIVECRHMSGGAPNCIPMVDRTPHGNLIEFAYVAEDLLKAIASQAQAQPLAAPVAASNGGAPATTKAPAKKAEAEPEEDDDDEDEGDAEAEGDEEEGDEGDEDEGEEGEEGGEAEGDAEEGDDEPNFAEMTRDALVDAVTQLKKEGVTIEWAKDWSDAKLRKAVEAGYAEYMAQDDAEDEDEGDDDADEEAEGDAEEGDEGEEGDDAEEGDEGEEGDEAEAEGDEDEGDEEEAPTPPKKKKKPAPAPIKKKKKKKSVSK